MKTKMRKTLGFLPLAGLVLLACLGPVSAQVVPPPVPEEELPPGSEVLTRGPVHEAFAIPVTMETQQPLTVTQQPPEPLEEMVPAAKPVGANVVWVPGYWAWDESRSDFIWVSGCWRNAPPQSYWVPGYWVWTGSGWQWIAGFWKSLLEPAREQIEYLPAPPAPVDIKPPRTSPLPDQVWVPGCWYYVGSQYVHRPGYWVTPQVGWVWIPSHYVWTPRGYIFVAGRWDYDLDNRGVLFAPVYFPPVVRVRPAFVFSPLLCVDLGMLRLNLFVYPRYRHYCFGDYYDAAYVSVGIYPWYHSQTVYTWYDPLFTYERWSHRRTNPDWAKSQARDFRDKRSHQELRPPRTHREWQAHMDRLPPDKRPERPLVQPLRTFAASQVTPAKFERIGSDERELFGGKSRESRQFRDQRSRWEAPVEEPSITAPREVQPPRKTDNPPGYQRRTVDPATGNVRPDEKSPNYERRTVDPATGNVRPAEQSPDYQRRSVDPGTGAARPAQPTPPGYQRRPVTPSTRSADETELRIIRPEPLETATERSRSSELRTIRPEPLESATERSRPTELRIIRPEPLAIPTPSSPARPSDSRYIPKESPSRPSQDSYQTIPTEEPRGRGRRR